MTFRALFGAVSLLITSLMSVAPAAAAPAAALPRVVLVRSSGAPASVSEALVRLRGELIAAGFEAEVIDLPLGADVRASLEKLAPPTGTSRSATALVAVVASGDPGTVELWVIDRVTGKTVIRRVNAPTADPARAAEILAVRAVELLRASFLELAIAPPADTPAPVPAAPAVQRWATATLEERDWTWALEAGGGTAAAVGGPWNAFLAVARIERALGLRACVRLAFVGLGTTGLVNAPNGSGELSQTVMLAELLFRFRHGRRLEPLISLGAGALRVNVDAQESAPYQGIGGVRWAFAADLGLGVRVPLQRHRFELDAEAHVLLAQPFPTVEYFGQELARAGRPTLLGTVTFLGGI